MALFQTDVKAIVDEEVQSFQAMPKHTEMRRIPKFDEVPFEKENWIKIDNVICAFVDMEGSTQLSAGESPNNTARAYRLFTQTAIRIFDWFEASYIDIKGDGVFAIFDNDKAHNALAATVSIKTFVSEHFTPEIKGKLKKTIGGHFGIDARNVVIRRLGMRRNLGRNDRQNVVWAGRPVNMAAKLASLTSKNALLVSPRFHGLLAADEALKSCGCGNDGVKKDLWKEHDLSEDDRFDFDKAFLLTSNWCSTHGAEFCGKILGA